MHPKDVEISVWRRHLHPMFLEALSMIIKEWKEPKYRN
jgi:hypothetical protein